MPVVFALDGERVVTPINGKPKRVAGNQLQRVRNIAANDRVSLVVDHTETAMLLYPHDATR